MNTKSITIALAAALSALAFSSTVQAKEEKAPQREIDLRGYDLSDPADLAKVQKSVRFAARKVCTINREAGLSHIRAENDCMENAIKLANAKIERLVAQGITTQGTTVALQSSSLVPPAKR